MRVRIKLFILLLMLFIAGELILVPQAAASSVVLSCVAPTDETPDHYNFYRSTAMNSGYVLVGSSSYCGFIDFVQANQAYFYAVTAVDSSGDESVYSNIFTINVPLYTFASSTGLL